MQKQCPRCGIVWEILLTRKNPDLCQSCRARKQTKIGECLIWQGHYAEDMVTPIREDGSLVMQGERSCGHKDCVNEAHRKETK